MRTRILHLHLLLVGAVILAGLIGFDASPEAAHAQTYPTIDGQYSGTGKIGPSGSFTMTVTGRGGVPPSGVGAVALNVTVTNPASDSYLTAYPAGAVRPTAANLVFHRGQTVPNMVVVKVGVGGQITFFNYAGTTDLVVDVLGWFPEGAAFSGVTPARILDTRPGYPTIDGLFTGSGAVGAAGSKVVTVVGRGGIAAAGVGSVALNVTVVGATAPSFLTVWPTGAPRPTAANLNYSPGETLPNMVIAKVGEGGQISLFNYAGQADLVVDVLGWFPSAGSFTGVTPARLMDSRAGYPTIDAQAAGGGAIGTGETRELTVIGRGDVPSGGVGAVALNVAATNPTAASFITVFPTGAVRPTAANLNFVRGQTVPNMVIVKVGDSGRISFYNLAGSVDVVVDVLGWFPDAGAYAGITPARLMDSRRDPAAPPAPPAGSHVCAPGEADVVASAWIDADRDAVDEFVQYCADDPVPPPTPPTPPPATPPTTSPTPPTTPPAPASIRPGTYQVNVQIQPGRYLLTDARRGCYWERLSGFGGSFAEIIANDFRDGGRAIVDIAASDVGFKFDNDCGNMRAYTPLSPMTPFFGAGDYVVGQDIPAGTYVTTASAGCYWERVRGFSGSFGDIVDNDFVDGGGQQIVTIRPDDVGFKTDADCGTWVLTS